jgi:hypothetical protein
MTENKIIFNPKMFYKKEDVNDVMICFVCLQTYTDPRILPCGETACSNCIQQSTNLHNEFSCACCSKKHTPVDEQGFPANRSLLKLLNKKAENVTRHPRADELRAKLEEMKAKCEDFKLNMEIDECDVKISEHCVLLMNEVDLATEMFIERVHGLNESLAGEIKTYEQGSIETFKNEKEKRVQANEKLIADINKFYTETSKQLEECKIDDKIVDESLESVAKLIGDLSKENEWTKYTNMTFARNEDQIENRLLGRLVMKKIAKDCLFQKFNKIDLSSVLTSYLCDLHIFLVDNGTYVALYIDRNNQLVIKSFNKKGKVLGDHSNSSYLNQINKLNVVQLNGNFLVSVSNKFQLSDVSGGRIPSGNHVMMYISDKFQVDYSHFSFLHDSVKFLAANRSHILCIESGYREQVYYRQLDSPIFYTVKTLQTDRFLSRNEGVVDLKMNDSYAFFLCNTKKLKIFDLKALALVKVIETNADQIQMFSDNSFALFDSANRIVDKYDQSDEFKKVECFDLARSFERGFQFSVDNPDHFTFYNNEYVMFSDMSELETLNTNVDPSRAEPSKSGSQQEHGVKRWIEKLKDTVPYQVSIIEFIIIRVGFTLFVCILFAFIFLFLISCMYLLIYFVVFCFKNSGVPQLFARLNHSASSKH